MLSAVHPTHLDRLSIAHADISIVSMRARDKRRRTLQQVRQSLTEKSVTHKRRKKDVSVKNDARTDTYALTGVASFCNYACEQHALLKPIGLHHVQRWRSMKATKCRARRRVLMDEYEEYGAWKDFHAAVDIAPHTELTLCYGTHYVSQMTAHNIPFACQRCTLE